MAEQPRIRVMTVDDHEIMRGGIKFVLLAFDDLELVAEAGGGDEALRLCGDVDPDVVLMDMKMPDMDGIATTEAIKQLYPRVQVLVLTSYHDEDLVRQAMKAGAVGYVLKDTSKEGLADAVRAAHTGQTTLSPEVAEALAQESDAPPPLSHEISEREQEVLVLLARGHSNKQIAERLHRSPYTIRHHVSQIIAKLGAANRAEAAVMAVQRGLVK